ncbi:poly-gamma-glutamate biosynthesis protein PgsC/CapC [Corynebacterium tapiri]|uniref:Uncharacterized protein n=1 Tax=Corynebacterium tapiri TaxID=1448266 RepID=A0A5C4U2M5_9CORY|nr:poly-gamma-glutamate biosynthesis protein PgsC/CapC [Corynebacterium tapiri]TNL96641.1 hypothetical protein FHE74_08055 [Corynebacterium tapiri]
MTLSGYDLNTVEGYDFFLDYTHVAFVLGLLVSFVYFRRTHVSAGGSLAVGYLAAAMFYPLNVVATLAISAVAFCLIRFVILKIWLPRPRMIFSIGLMTGVSMGLIWLIVQHVWLNNRTDLFAGLSLVGIVIPGMICNSLNKQGVMKTLLPIAWMVPLTAVISLALTWVGNKFEGATGQEMFAPGEADAWQLFVLGAVSVVGAILILDGPLSRLQLRTGGYVTAGIFVSALDDWRYLVLPILTAFILWLVVGNFLKRVPLFGKDRFVLMILSSVVTFACLQHMLYLATGQSLNGSENLVFMVLPAIFVNDVVQYGIRRVLSGFGLNVLLCLVVAGGLWAVA